MRQDIVITEGIEGQLNFHISKLGNDRLSLCGVHTMRSRMPLGMWGTVGNAHECYCNKCASIAGIAAVPRETAVKTRGPFDDQTTTDE